MAALGWSLLRITVGVVAGTAALAAITSLLSIVSGSL
jgi:hypothetical protein